MHSELPLYMLLCFDLFLELTLTWKFLGFVSRRGTAGAVIAALMKVAAVESPDNQWQVVTEHNSTPGTVLHGTAAGADQHGLYLNANKLSGPRLLRTPM